jgi:hypothetical protein
MTVVKRIWKQLVLVAVVTVMAASLAAGVAAGDDDPKGLRIKGAATTMLEGGTGAPDFVPVLTKLAFHWDGKEGDLECLALAPSDAAGDPGSGDFDTNVMYVTGPVRSALVRGETAVLMGTATVTGIGAGKDLPFRLTVDRGVSGTTAVLEVSGLVFKEIVLEGRISF